MSTDTDTPRDESRCEVEIHGAWYPARVRSWGARPYASPPGWWARVAYSATITDDARPHWIPASRVHTAAHEVRPADDPAHV